LDIGVLGYIGIVLHKEHSPEVSHIPPGTPCIILEQSTEWQAILYVTFIDSEKASDFVKREIMLLTLQECGIPRKIIQIIKILYDGFECKISHEGKLSDFTEVRNGVRHIRMYSVPNYFSANIRQSNEKSERFKERGNTVKYEGKIGRSGLCR